MIAGDRLNEHRCVNGEIVLPSRFHQLWLQFRPLPWDKAIRYTLGISVPLLVGFGVGQLRYGVVALIGSMYVVNIANVDTRAQDRLLATLVGSLVITGCAELGGQVNQSPGLIEAGVLLLGIAAGWLHSSHMAIEIMARFSVLGFLFGALQLAAFGTEVIAIDARVVLIFLVGGLWTTVVLAIEHLLFPSSRLATGPPLAEGWQRIRQGQTAGFRFALCYGIVAAIALAGSLGLHLPRPFWVTATTLVVMKPDSRATVQRTSQRVLGTLIGVLLVDGIITLTPDPRWLLACITLAAPLIPLGLARNYTLCCAAITVLVMVMIDLLTLAQGGDQALLSVRFWATLMGCGLTAMATAITYPELWLKKTGDRQ